MTERERRAAACAILASAMGAALIVLLAWWTAPAHGQWAQPGTSVRPRLLSSVAVSPVATGSTVYLALDGGDVSPTQADVAHPYDRVVLRRLRCAVSVAPGTGESVSLTVQTGACGTALADSAVACTISGTATTASDLADAITVADGECAALKATYSAGAAASLPRAQLAAF